MVARLEPVKSISKPLSYNQEKVTQGQAELIHVGNFLQDKNDIAYADMLDRFQRLNELNTRAEVKMLHATLNFHPSEKLSDKELSAIADRYMEGLQMEDQPYLVYRHQDTNHPHIHIVTSLIRSDGSRINTHRMANRLSEPTRKAIEKEFQLMPSQRQKRGPVPSPKEVQKIVPDSPVPVTEAMDNILASVTKHYHFSNLHEYNAILRTYNVTVETGSPGSKTKRYNGLYYLALDDQGNRISPPVMASQFPSRPTLSRLNEKFNHPDANHPDRLASIRARIDWVLDQQPPNLPVLVSQLQADGIDIVRSPSNGRNPHDQVFVDHRTRTAVTGETLGIGYTSTAITHAIAEHQQPRQRQHQKSQTQQETRFSANVPQVLSSLLHTEPSSLRFEAFGQDQSLGHRHKR
jgi:hypothetical protein